MAAFALQWRNCVDVTEDPTALNARHIDYKAFIRKGTLAGVAQLVEHCPTKGSVTGSIPGQDTCLPCGPGPWLGSMQEATN